MVVVAIVISVVLFFAPNDGLPSYSEEEKVEALLQDEEATSNTTIAKWYNIGIWILKGSAQMKK